MSYVSLRRSCFAVLVAAGPLLGQVDWRKAPVLERKLDPIAYDVARGVAVMFTRATGPGTPETWEWNGAAWALRSLAIQPPVNGHHQLAYDWRGNVLLWGGESPVTWTYDGIAWTSFTVGAPPQRTGHRMAFDPVRMRAVLFGGRTLPGVPVQFFGDTWEWDGGTWTQRTPAQAPSARWGHAMAFDFASGEMLMFGGAPGAPADDTWSYDGVNWRQRTPANSPLPRYEHAMASDQARSRVVLCCGRNGTVVHGDTWEWDGAVWRQIAGASPGLRYQHQMTFDAARGVTLVSSGFSQANVVLGDLRQWDGALWSQAQPAAAPPTSADSVTVYDSNRSRLVHLIDPSTVWEWDGVRWQEIPAPGGPSFPLGGEAAFDAARGRTVLIAGGASSLWGGHWEWNGVAWTRNQGALPPLRIGHALSYDAWRQVVVLFGGSSQVFTAETWEWDGLQWTQRTPPSAPSPRTNHAMAFDTRRGETVLYGGGDQSAILADTWEWDGTRWAQRAAASAPGAQNSHAMTFDEARERVVLADRLLATWDWDGATWSRRQTAASPGARTRHLLTFDAARGVVALYGGQALTDLWELSAVQPATATPFGAPCSGTAGAPALTTESSRRPWLGDTVALRAAPVPAAPGLALFVLGLSRTAWNGSPLPQPLDAFGMPGCLVHASVDATSFALATGGAATLALAVPNQPSLLGLEVYAQAAALDPQANAFGAVTSNGLALRVGGR